MQVTACGWEWQSVSWGCVWLQFWMVVFPEGTRYNPQLQTAIDKSHSYAQLQGDKLHVTLATDCWPWPSCTDLDPRLVNCDSLLTWIFNHWPRSTSCQLWHNCVIVSFAIWFQHSEDGSVECLIEFFKFVSGEWLIQFFYGHTDVSEKILADLIPMDLAVFYFGHYK